MTTNSVADIVFCLDASASMQPCIDSVRRHFVDFIRGLESTPNKKVSWRVGLLSYACDEPSRAFALGGLQHSNQNLIDALYKGSGQGFFTSSLEEFQSALENVRVKGDEATLVAIDTALDFPWRLRSQCHRVVVCMTDEPLESNALLEWQREKMPALLDKIAALGVMLYLVAPASPGFDTLAEVDKSEYEVVDVTGDGLRSVQFDKVLAYIAKSISLASLQSVSEQRVVRGLFGQADWTPSRGAQFGGR